TFGREMYYPHVDTQLPSDEQRITALRSVVDAGYADRLLIAQDICFTHELVRHGGHGYAHILHSIRPRLLRRGLTKATLDTILVAATIQAGAAAVDVALRLIEVAQHGDVGFSAKRERAQVRPQDLPRGSDGAAVDHLSEGHAHPQELRGGVQRVQHGRVDRAH